MTAEELEQFCQTSDRLAPYKRPRAYYFIDALPRNASGKIQKFLLREQLKNRRRAERRKSDRTEERDERWQLAICARSTRFSAMHSASF